MSEDKNQVGVIHEVGDFGLIGELSQEDQKAFKEKDKKKIRLNKFKVRCSTILVEHHLLSFITKYLSKGG